MRLRGWAGSQVRRRLRRSSRLASARGGARRDATAAEARPTHRARPDVSRSPERAIALKRRLELNRVVKALAWVRLGSYIRLSPPAPAALADEIRIRLVIIRAAELGLNWRQAARPLGLTAGALRLRAERRGLRLDEARRHHKPLDKPTFRAIERFLADLAALDETAATGLLEPVARMRLLDELDQLGRWLWIDPHERFVTRPVIDLSRGVEDQRGRGNRARARMLGLAPDRRSSHVP